MKFAIVLLLGILTRIWWVVAFIVAIASLIVSILFAMAAAILNFPSRIISWIGGCFYAFGVGLGNLTNAQILKKLAAAKKK
jgi:hypothetical protein